MGNKPGAAGGAAGGAEPAPSSSPVVSLPLVAAQQRLALARVFCSHRAPGGGAGPASAGGGEALLPALLASGPDAALGQLAVAVAAAMPPVLSGRFEGTWVLGPAASGGAGEGEGGERARLAAEPSREERQYSYAVTLDTAALETRQQHPSSPVEVRGALEWRLLRAPKSSPGGLDKRVGERAQELVTGTLQGGELALTGYRSTNPRLIGTDSYRLRLPDPGRDESRMILGESKGQRGLWDGRLKLRRVVAPVGDPDEHGFLTTLSA